MRHWEATALCGRMEISCEFMFVHTKISTAIGQAEKSSVSV